MAQDSGYLTARDAAAALGVRPQTLYAYVSRGLIRSEATGGRERRYHAADIAALRRKRDPAEAAPDFDRHRPDVLVLAFRTLEEAQRHHLTLYRQCHALQDRPHRVIVLCREEERPRAYDLCRGDVFDDYVPFWPQPADPTRILMAVHHAVRALAGAGEGAPTPAEYAAQARRLADLEATLSRGLASGDQHIGATERAIAKAAQDLVTSLAGHDQGPVPEALLTGPLRAVAEAFQPMTRWAGDLRRESQPHLESLRALQALADRFQPLVLAVDDDDFQLRLVEHLLIGEGYRVACAGSGIEALNGLRKAMPDVVLMDISMPDMDGLELTRRMKGQDRFRHIPIIMVTGNSEELVVTDCLNAGADNFMVKPLGKASLLAKLGRALAAKEAK